MKQDINIKHISLSFQPVFCREQPEDDPQCAHAPCVFIHTGKTLFLVNLRRKDRKRGKKSMDVSSAGTKRKRSSADSSATADNLSPGSRLSPAPDAFSSTVC
ncbi:unnamed protein product [Pleuronectes platessa]|uniref:Uncharacterized protein n=1 Tax=Pleuronectes platessa TaxID=8262 RepID=A0A9N7Y8K5_PLEPL|nr:unnamed protein product [Pleuronectes platessa]